MTLALATASYRTMRRDLGIGVAISIGIPRWPVPYDLEKCRELAPWGLLRKPRLSPLEFDTRYRMRLDAAGGRVSELL
jgi:hypothetical protein